MAYDPLEKLNKFQDDIWEQIRLNDVVRDVIDTPEFQRLSPRLRGRSLHPRLRSGMTSGEIKRQHQVDSQTYPRSGPEK
jgi:hypothetical protein